MLINLELVMRQLINGAYNVHLLAARESTPPKRNCVADFVPVKACYVIAVETLSLF